MISSVDVPDFQSNPNIITLGKRLAQEPLVEPKQWTPRVKTDDGPYQPKAYPHLMPQPHFNMPGASMFAPMCMVPFFGFNGGMIDPSGMAMMDPNLMMAQ